MKTIALSLLMAAGALMPAAHAQNAKWPERPVRVVVPFAPGGTTDVVARLLAPRLSEELGQQFVIDNRAGAGGTIGVEIVVRGTPDGHTVLVGASSYASNAALYNLSFDPLTGITPVTLITTGPFIAVVHPSVKATSIKDLIALAKAKPDSITFGSSGIGGVPHLATEHFKQMAGISMLHVPFKGDGAALPALLGNQIQLYFGGPLVFAPIIARGQVRALAITTEKRSPVMPDLPAISETVPGYSAITWFGVWLPPKTPKAIAARLHEAVGRALKNPQVAEKMRDNGMEIAHNSPEAFSQFVASEISKWKKVVKAGNIKVE